MKAYDKFNFILVYWIQIMIFG